MTMMMVLGRLIDASSRNGWWWCTQCDHRLMPDKRSTGYRRWILEMDRRDLEEE